MLYYALIALAVLAAVLVLFLIVVAMQPSQFRIERKGKITAPPAIVFGHVNDLHKWTSWSPWENNFMAKAFGLLMNMDKLVGSDFEKGLAGMKAVAEAPAT
jgi:hypothetical protein